jgi:hypothetical protein
VLSVERVEVCHAGNLAREVNDYQVLRIVVRNRAARATTP